VSNNNPIDAQLSLIYIDSGSHDPSISPTGGTKGTIFIQVQGAGSPQILQKQDEGQTANWLPVGGGGGGGANTALSNLTGTAINQNLVSDANNTRSLGSAANQWSIVYAGQVTSLGGGAALNVATGNGLFSADLTLASGNAAGGNSGNINLYTGTATGTQGVISFNNDLVPTIPTAFSIMSLQRIGANLGFIVNLRDLTNDDVMNTTDRQMFFPAAFGGIAMDFGGDNAIGFLTNTVRLDSKYTSGFSSPGSPSLVFNSPNLSIIATIDNNLANATPTSDLYFKSGSKLNAGATNDTGALYIGSGINQGTGNSGGVNITSGDANIGNSGDITLNTPTPSSGTQGTIHISGLKTNFNLGLFLLDPTYTSAALGANPSLIADSATVAAGYFQIGTTDITSATTSGGMAAFSGNNDGGPTGPFYAFTGSINGAVASDTGELSFGTGGISVAGASGATGPVTIYTGQNDGTGNSGLLSIVTGDATNGGNSGNVQIATGAASSGVRGKLDHQGAVVFRPETTQVLGAAFTITSSLATYVPISSAGIVTSSAVTAIQSGAIAGQIIILDNQGAFDIILKQSANIELPGGIDYTISIKGVIEFVWTGSIWRCKGSSAN